MPRRKIELVSNGEFMKSIESIADNRVYALVKELEKCKTTERNRQMIKHYLIAPRKKRVALATDTFKTEAIALIRWTKIIGMTDFDKATNFQEQQAYSRFNSEAKGRKGEPVKANTIQRARRVILGFIRWKTKYVLDKPFNKESDYEWLQTILPTDFTTETTEATLKDVERMSKVCTHPRDHALLWMGFELGLSNMEARGIFGGDVKIDGYGLYVEIKNVKKNRSQKGKKRYLGKSESYARVWKNMHAQIFGKEADNTPFFSSYISKYGKKMWIKVSLSSAGLNKIITTLGKRAGIEKRLTFQSLRRGTTNYYRKKGWQPSEIAAWSGHSVKTMFKHYDKVKQEDVNARFLMEAGKLKPEQMAEMARVDPEKNKICFKCKTVNPSEYSICMADGCNFPLTADTEAIKQSADIEIKKLREEMEEQKNELEMRLELLESVREGVEEMQRDKHTMLNFIGEELKKNEKTLRLPVAVKDNSNTRTIFYTEIPRNGKRLVKKK